MSQCDSEFILAEGYYNHLQRLVYKTWVSKQIIYIPIYFNTRIENSYKQTSKICTLRVILFEKLKINNDISACTLACTPVKMK